MKPARYGCTPDAAMMTRRFPFLLFLIVSLLCSQQIALAHTVSHIGEHHHHSNIVEVEDAETGHDEPLSVSHPCSLCAATAAFDFPIYLNDPVLPSPDISSAGIVVIDRFPPSQVKPFHFLSRAPPFSSPD